MDDPKKHKFKIEAIIAESALQGKDAKDIFEYYENSKTLVSGQALKLNTLFINSQKGSNPVDFGELSDKKITKNYSPNK